MSNKIEELDCLSDVLRVALMDAGVKNLRGFIRKWRTSDGRTQLMRAGVTEADVKHCQQLLDLSRVSGVGPGYAGLLVAVGVTSTEQLAREEPGALHVRMTSSRAKAPWVKRMATAGEVVDWVGDAGAMPPFQG